MKRVTLPTRIERHLPEQAALHARRLLVAQTKLPPRAPPPPPEGKRKPGRRPRLRPR
jgi:hypothetical protein